MKASSLFTTQVVCQLLAKLISFKFIYLLVILLNQTTITRGLPLIYLLDDIINPLFLFFAYVFYTKTYCLVWYSVVRNSRQNRKRFKSNGWMEKEANKSRIYCTYMIEVEIAFVAAQVILLLVSNKGLFFVAVPCVCPNEAAMNRKERERK